MRPRPDVTPPGLPASASRNASGVARFKVVEVMTGSRGRGSRDARTDGPQHRGRPSTHGTRRGLEAAASTRKRWIAILDVDGTLVDTNYHHAIAWFRAFQRHFLTLQIWRIHRHIGMGGDQLVAALAGDEVEERLGDSIREAESELYRELIGEVQAMEGSRRLIEDLKDAGQCGGAGELRQGVGGASTISSCSTPRRSSTIGRPRPTSSGRSPNPTSCRRRSTKVDGAGPRTRS